MDTHGMRVCAYHSWRRADQRATNTRTDTPITGSQENSIQCTRSLPWEFHRWGAVARVGAHSGQSTPKTLGRPTRKPPQRTPMGRPRRIVVEGVAAREHIASSTPSSSSRFSRPVIYFLLRAQCVSQALHMCTELVVTCPVARSSLASTVYRPSDKNNQKGTER